MKIIQILVFALLITNIRAFAEPCSSPIVGSCSNADAPELCIDLPANAPFAQGFAASCEQIDGVYAPIGCASLNLTLKSCTLPQMPVGQQAFTGTILRFYVPATDLQATRMCQEYGAVVCQ